MKLNPQFIMPGDLLPVSFPGDEPEVDSDLFYVTTTATRPDGWVVVFGYLLIGSYEGALAPLDPNKFTEVWSRVLA